MTTTAPSPDLPATHGRQALPWPALLVLGAATLVMVTGEMLPTAVLGPMSDGLGVSEAASGLLVSAWALVVVVASFPLVRLVRTVDRRVVIAGSLVAFAVSAGATASAPSYDVVVVARILGAASVGLLWSTVNAHVADLVPDRLLGRATAVVLGGATLGMVLGTPVGRFVADAAGWRASFWVLAVASLAVAVAVRAFVPGAPAGSQVAEGAAGRAAATRTVGAVTALVALALVGHYGAYTFVTRLADHPAGLVPGGTGGVLLAFGVASALGVALAGRVTTGTAAALVVATLATAAALLGLVLADRFAALGLLVLVLWGVASGALPPLAQTLILRLAGPERRAFAGALIPVLFNGGIAVGAAVAAGVVASSGVGSLPVPAAVLVAIAGVGLALAAGRQPRRAASH